MGRKGIWEEMRNIAFNFLSFVLSLLAGYLDLPAGSGCIILFYFILCHAMLCYAIPFHSILCSVKSRQGKTRQGKSFHIMLCTH